MSRKKSNSDSSLELLLDTITNTFGGILFLAILVSLMLRTTSKQVGEAESHEQPVSALEQVQLQNRMNELRADAEVMMNRIAVTKSVPTLGVEEPSTRERDTAIKNLQSSLDDESEAARSLVELQRKAAQSREAAKALEEERKTINTRLTTAETRIEEVQKESAALAAKMLAIEQAAAASSEQTVSLPNLRPSNKDEVGIYIRFQRVFMMHAWEGGNRIGPNTKQFVVVTVDGENGVEQVARPKPAAGIPLHPGTVGQTLRDLLRPFPPGRFVVSLIVFDDSFDYFQPVKLALVQSGYEYRPMPLRSGQSVVDFGGVGEAQ